MLRDITLGQYYQTESVIHKLDPRVKLGGTLLYIISLFLFENVVGYVLAALFLAFVIKMSKVPFKFMVRGMKAILFLLLLTVVFNLFLTPGEPLISLWKLTVTKEGENTFMHKLVWFLKAFFKILSDIGNLPELLKDLG